MHHIIDRTGCNPADVNRFYEYLLLYLGDESPTGEGWSEGRYDQRKDRNCTGTEYL